MRLLALSILAVVTIAGCSKNEAPPTLKSALRNTTSLELHSLDPALKGKEADSGDVTMFQIWNDLGFTDVSAPAIRKRLLDSLDAGIADNDGRVAACFEPRHGLRATHDGKVYDVVICFKCYQAKWYIDDVPQKAFLLTAIPRPTFDAILTDASVKLPPPASK